MVNYGKFFYLTSGVGIGTLLAKAYFHTRKSPDEMFLRYKEKGINAAYEGLFESTQLNFTRALRLLQRNGSIDYSISTFSELVRHAYFEGMRASLNSALKLADDKRHSSVVENLRRAIGFYTVLNSLGMNGELQEYLKTQIQPTTAVLIQYFLVQVADGLLEGEPKKATLNLSIAKRLQNVFKLNPDDRIPELEEAVNDLWKKRNN